MRRSGYLCRKIETRCRCMSLNALNVAFAPKNCSKERKNRTQYRAVSAESQHCLCFLALHHTLRAVDGPERRTHDQSPAIPTRK